MNVRTGLGQDSHRFESETTGKAFTLAGHVFEGEMLALEGNSDADVVLHALTNAVSGVTGHNVIGPVSDSMCQAGISDSREYLKTALKSLGKQRLSHVSVALEAAKPKMLNHIPLMRESLAALLGLKIEDIGITATSGERLTSFGKGEGVQAFVIVTAVED